jgi:hypothetical protein
VLAKQMAIVEARVASERIVMEVSIIWVGYRPVWPWG